MGLFDEFIKNKSDRPNFSDNKKNKARHNSNYNFKYLDDLIQSSEDEIILEHDVTVDMDEIVQYNLGIFIAKDNLVIDGNGHTIDALKEARIFNVTGQNITLKNINFKNASSKLAGAALHNGGTLTVRDCTFEDNHAEDMGGAINNADDGALSVFNSTFLNNDTHRSAGAIASTGKIMIDDSKFSNNSASSMGGAILVTAESEINNCIFENNYSKEEGGCISSNVKEGELKIVGCEFVNNSSGGKGSVSYNVAKLSILKSDFKNNSSKDAATIRNEGNLDIAHCIFEGNSAENMAGALMNTGFCNISNSNFESNESKMVGAITNGGTMAINESTFSQNDGKEYVGAISNIKDLKITNSKFHLNKSIGGISGAIDNSLNLEIKNCEFIGNMADNGGGAIFNIGHVKIEDSDFLRNISVKFGNAIVNFKGDAEVYNSDFGHDTERKVIYNGGNLKFVNSKFFEIIGSAIIDNNKDGSLSILGGEFVNNITSKGAIVNGGRASVSGSVFANYYSDDIKYQDIVNFGNLSLKEPKFKNQHQNKSILNKGHIDARKLKRSHFEKISENNGTIDYLTFDAEEDESASEQDANNVITFNAFDELIHNSGNNEIVLENDVLIKNYEIDFYEGGIDLDVDNLVIDGNGHIIDANSRGRIFNIVGKNIIIKNVVFKNGKSFNVFEEHTNGGGAIRLVKDSSAILKDCKFINNGSDDDGGAILNNGELYTQNCKFNDNQCKGFGGAILNKNILFVDSDEFNSNSAEFGAIIYNSGDLSVDNISLSNNQSDLTQSIVNNASIKITDIDVNVDDLIYNLGTINEENLDVEYTSFSELNEVINDYNEIELEEDIIFDFKVDEALVHGIDITSDRLVLDGKGLSIDARNKAIFFNISENSSVRFQNIIFKNAKTFDMPIIRNQGAVRFVNCKFEGNQSLGEGSLISNVRSLVFSQCTFSNNVCNDSLILSRGLSLTISESDFLNNVSKRGNIIFNSRNISLVIENTKFLNNESSSRSGLLSNFGDLEVIESEFITNNSRFGLIVNNSNLKVSKCKFIKNQSQLVSGVVHNSGDSSILDSIFKENKIGIGGYSIVNENNSNLNIGNSQFSSYLSSLISNEGEIEIQNSKFNDNASGVLVNSNMLKISYSEFLDNSNNDSGGAIVNSGELKLDNSIFKNNTTSKEGGAIMNEKTGSIDQENCEFYGNSPDDIYYD